MTVRPLFLILAPLCLALATPAPAAVKSSRDPVIARSARIGRDLVLACPREVRGAYAAARVEGGLAGSYYDARALSPAAARTLIAEHVRLLAVELALDGSPDFTAQGLRNWSGIIDRDRAAGRDTRMDELNLCMFRRWEAVQQGRATPIGVRPAPAPAFHPRRYP